MPARKAGNFFKARALRKAGKKIVIGKKGRIATETILAAHLRWEKRKGRKVMSYDTITAREIPSQLVAARLFSRAISRKFKGRLSDEQHRILRDVLSARGQKYKNLKLDEKSIQVQVPQHVLLVKFVNSFKGDTLAQKIANAKNVLTEVAKTGMEFKKIAEENRNPAVTDSFKNAAGAFSNLSMWLEMFEQNPAEIAEKTKEFLLKRGREISFLETKELYKVSGNERKDLETTLKLLGKQRVDIAAQFQKIKDMLTHER